MSDHKDAVFIGEQAAGTVVAIGREDKQEWLKSRDLPCFELDEMR
jgi:hypothetical protein